MCEVLITGMFNVVHSGHCELFEFASQFGKVTVGIKADRYLYDKYGLELTVPAINRAKVLRSIKTVSDVVMFTEENPSALIIQLQPTHVAYGPNYNGVVLEESEAIFSVGADVLIHQANKEHSSSNIVKSLNANIFVPSAGKLPRTWQDY